MYTWGWPKDRPRKEGGPYRHRIDFRTNDKTKRQLEKLGEERSEWLRELVEDSLDAQDPPETMRRTLTPIDYWRIADHKLKKECPFLHAILPAVPPRLGLPNIMYWLQDS